MIAPHQSVMASPDHVACDLDEETVILSLKTGEYYGLNAVAADKQADPSGTWTWSTPGRDGGPARQSTLKLKLDAGKLTGTVSGRQSDTAIGDATIKGDEISFTVTREFQGNKVVQKYTGKLAGDTIKGKISFERNGEAQSLVAPRLRQDEGVDPDQPAFAIDQRASTIAGVDGGICLNVTEGRCLSHRTSRGADHTQGDRVPETHGISDRQNQVALVQALRRSKLQSRKRFRVDLQ